MLGGVKVGCLIYTSNYDFVKLYVCMKIPLRVELEGEVFGLVKTEALGKVYFPVDMFGAFIFSEAIVRLFFGLVRPL